MDTRLLKAFTVVFEERNITQAAQKAHISQPALSASIHQLEDAIGRQLFRRNAKGVEVTEAARRLYPKALRLLSELGSLPDLFQEQSQTPFALQIMPDVGHGALARFLAQSRRLIPDVFFSLTAWALPSVTGEDGKPDARFALDVLRREDELFLCVMEDEYLFCMRPDHPLASKELITPDDLDGIDFIVCPPCEAHQRTLGLCAGHRRGVRVAAQADQKSQVAALALAGAGVTFLPQSLLEETPGLITRPFESPRFSRRMGLCYTPDMASHPVIEAWRAHVAAGGTVDSELPNSQ